MRLFFQITFFGTLLLFCSAHRGRPNIILMNMDDLGWGDLGVMGEPSRETPNLDKMAEEGMLFTNFYTAAAICSPSRAAMLTGRLPIRNGFYSDNFQGRNAYTPQEIVGGISDSEILVSELLLSHGYQTKLVGKWHLGHRDPFLPTRHGFQEWFGAPNCHFRYDGKEKAPNIPVYRNKQMIGRYYEDQEFHIDLATGESNLTKMYRDVAVEFIQRFAINNNFNNSIADIYNDNNNNSIGDSDNKNPFFLYWAPDATHAPTYASKEFLGTSRRGTTYGDAVRELDSAVGDILNSLKVAGIEKDTLVIFTSDNGAALVSKQHAGSNGPLLCGKQTTFEGGFRTPTIAWWPGTIEPGQIAHEIATQMDLFSTFLDLAKIDLPSDRQLDTFSLMQVLINGTDEVERPVFYYRGDLLYAVRKGPYKMHLWTWTTPEDELKKGIDHCPNVAMVNITTTDQRNHEKYPVLFHLDRDPGERYPISQDVMEYWSNVAELKKVEFIHKSSLERGKPQLNWCDVAVQNWSPNGCEKIKRCIKPPKSKPKRCFWPH